MADWLEKYDTGAAPSPRQGPDEGHWLDRYDPALNRPAPEEPPPGLLARMGGAVKDFFSRDAYLETPAGERVKLLTPAGEQIRTGMAHDDDSRTLAADPMAGLDPTAAYAAAGQPDPAETALETAASLGTGMLSYPGQITLGLTGIASGMSRADVDRLTGEFARATTYVPQGRTSRALSEAAGKGFDALLWPAHKLDRVVSELGYPRAAYVARVAAELAIFKGLHALGKKSTGFVKRKFGLDDAEARIVANLADDAKVDTLRRMFAEKMGLDKDSADRLIPALGEQQVAIAAGKAAPYNSLLAQSVKGLTEQARLALPPGQGFELVGPPKTDARLSEGIRQLKARLKENRQPPPADKVASVTSRPRTLGLGKPKPPATRLRGRIEELGKISWAGERGEMVDMPRSVSYVSNNRSGMHWRDMEAKLKDEGWLEPEESLPELLRTDPKGTLNRRHPADFGSIFTDPMNRLTDQEKEIRRQVEEPPEPEPDATFWAEQKELERVDELGSFFDEMAKESGVRDERRPYGRKRKDVDPAAFIPAPDGAVEPARGGEVNTGRVMPDYHARIDTYIARKYGDIIDLPESEAPHGIYHGIQERTLTAQALDKALAKAHNRTQFARDAKAAIADNLGDLAETYKYESHAEGKALEEYLDGLLEVIERHELPAAAVPSRDPAAATEPAKAAGRLSDHPGVSAQGSKGAKLYGGLPAHELSQGLQFWEKYVGGPLWDKLITKKIPNALEKIPVAGRGVSALRRALDYDYRGDLPDSKGYVSLLDETQLRRQTGAEYGVNLGNRLSRLPEKSQLRVGQAITGHDVALAPAEAKLASEASWALLELGKKAVDYGLLSEETFFKNAGKYMPRLYSQHEYRGLLRAYGEKAPTRLDLDRFKRRKDIPKEIRQQMGEILTPGYPVAKGIVQLTHSIETAKWLKTIADNPDWALRRTPKAEVLAEVEAAIAAAREASPRAPLKDILAGVARDFPDLSIYARRVKKAGKFRTETVIETAGDVPEGWVRLKDDPRLGELSGAYVHPEVARDVNWTLKAPDAAQKVMRKWLSRWKYGKVVLSAKTHIRNMYSNALLAHLGGMPLYEQPLYLLRAAREMRSGGKYWRMAKREGLLSSTYIQGELRSLFDRVESQMRGIREGSLEDTLTGIGKAVNRIRSAGKKLGDVYQAEEQWFKLAKFMHDIKRRGMSAKEAAADASKWLFDYGRVTRFQERYRSSLFGAPFATFCVSDDTQILTKRGWKKHHEILPDDEALTFRTGNDVLEWQAIDSVHVFPYSGEMLHIKSRSLDILMTPDHRNVVKREDGAGKRERKDYSRRYKTAIIRGHSLRKRDKIVVAGNYKAPSLPVYSDEFVEMAGWFVTDSYLHKPTNGLWCCQAKQAGKDALEDLRNRMGISGYAVKTQKKTSGNYLQSEYYIPAHIRDALYNALPDKELTISFLSRLTKHQLKILYETLMLTDGCKTGAAETFIQNAGQTLDAFQALCVMLGFQPGVSKKRQKCFAVRKTTVRSRQLKRNMPVEKPYSGVVWCPKTSNGTWVARRNHKVFITGNTFKAIPRVLEAAVKTPQRYVLPAAIIWALEEAARNKFGDTRQQAASKKASRPEWMQGNFLGIPNFARIPVADPFGREYWLNLSYILPWGELGESGGLFGIPAGLMPFSHPLTKEIAQQLGGEGGYDWFWGDRIVKPEDTAGLSGAEKAWAQVKARGKHALQTFAPTPVMDVMKLADAARGVPDYRGRERSLAPVLADVALGLKAYPVDYEDQAKRRLARLDPKRSEVARRILGRIRTAMVKRASVAKRGGSTELYDRQIAQYRRQLTGMMRQAARVAERKRRLRPRED